MSGDEQLDLFTVAPVVRAPASGPERTRPAVRTTAAERPSWGYYAGPHVACTEHVRRRHEGSLTDEGNLPPGRYKRRHKGTEQIMCGPCAMHWRAADGLTGALPSAPSKRK